MSTASGPGVVVVGTGFGCLTHVRALRAAGFDVLALVGRDEIKTADRAKRFDVPDAILRCTADADCELVDKIGCCGCRSGGARWAINRTQEDALRLFLKRACRHRTVCVQLDACQDDLAPACVDGGCVARIAPRGGATPLAPSASGAWANDG